MATNLPMASALGIVADGTTDQTSALTTILSNVAYGGLILDCPPIAGVNKGILISTALDCKGKKLVFAPGNYFTGVATISNGVIDAGFRQKCFDINSTGTINISLSNCSYATDKFSAMWYGTVPGTADTNYGIQKSIDTVIANQATMRTIFFPSGTYLINSPLVVYSWNGTAYNTVSVRLEGESPFWEKSGTGTIIQCNGFKNTFALGIQQGKGVEVDHIKFVGGFTPPALTTYQFYTCAYSAYTDGVSRDDQYSPYAGIVVDPFSSVAPTGGGYPSIVSYNGTVNFYRGSGAGGSTGCIFEDIYITNFVVGFITSPSGATVNAELMRITKIQIEACKAGIAGCQAQEKLNVVEHCACWGQTHTLFNIGGTDGYGAIGGGYWVIDGVNIAGSVNRMVSRRVSANPLMIKNVFAESLGIIGQWTGGAGDLLSDSTIAFVGTTVFPAYPSTFHLFAVQLTIRNCRIVLDGYPLWLSGGYYESCVFSRVPYALHTTTPPGTPTYKNCLAGGIPLNPDFEIVDNKVSTYLVGDNTRLVSKTSNPDAFKIMMTSSDEFYSQWPASTLQLDAGNFEASSYTIAANVATVTPPVGMNLNRVLVGTLAVYANGAVFGIVTAVGGTTYTVSLIPDGVVSGSGIIQQWHQVYFLSFMGSTVSGSNQISGVVVDFGNITNIISLGGYVKFPGFFGYRQYTQEARMLSYDAAGGTITMDRPCSFTANNVYFTNSGAIKNMVQNTDGVTWPTFPGAEIFPKGCQWSDNYGSVMRRRYMITKTGYYISSPQATWTEITALGTGAFPAYVVDTALATANYSVANADYINLPDLSGQANRNIVLPSSPAAGRVLIFRNVNTSGFTWTFTGAVVKNVSNVTVTTLTNATVYQLVFDGTNWNIID
jgi:hypothetical protein